MQSDPKSLWTPRLSNAPAVGDRTAKILAVTTTAEARARVQGLLLSEGSEVIFLDAFEAVVPYVEKNRVDVILLELEGEAERAIALSLELRGLDATNDVSILLVSEQLAREDVVARALLAGADDYVAAGDRTTEFRARVRVQLRNKRYRDALRRVRGEREAFRRQAAADPLTGLYNRGSLADLISDKVISGEPFALLFIDIDHFKSVNDRFGHTSGDIVLREVADCLRYGIRQGDFCGRYGGEEFVVVASDVTPEQAFRLAERHRIALAAMRLHELADEYQVTASIGVAMYDPDAAETSEDLLERADTSLYMAKSTGRNRVVMAGDPHTVRAPAPAPLPGPIGPPVSGFHERFGARRRVKNDG